MPLSSYLVKSHNRKAKRVPDVVAGFCDVWPMCLKIVFVLCFCLTSMQVAATTSTATVKAADAAAVAAAAAATTQ